MKCKFKKYHALSRFLHGVSHKRNRPLDEVAWGGKDIISSSELIPVVIGNKHSTYTLPEAPGKLALIWGYNVCASPCFVRFVWMYENSLTSWTKNTLAQKFLLQMVLSEKGLCKIWVWPLWSHEIFVHWAWYCPSPHPTSANDRFLFVI